MTEILDCAMFGVIAVALWVIQKWVSNLEAKIAVAHSRIDATQDAIDFFGFRKQSGVDKNEG